MYWGVYFALSAAMSPEIAPTPALGDTYFTSDVLVAVFAAVFMSVNVGLYVAAAVAALPCVGCVAGALGGLHSCSLRCSLVVVLGFACFCASCIILVFW